MLESRNWQFVKRDLPWVGLSFNNGNWLDKKLNRVRKEGKNKIHESDTSKSL